MPSSHATNSEPLATAKPATVTIDCEDRWQVYHRLQSLGIEAQCKSFQPLQVTINTPTEAIQLWSVIKHVCGPRQVIAQALDKSWQLKPYAREL